MIIFYALVMLLSGTVFGMEKGIVSYHGYPIKSKVEMNQDCMLFAIADDDLQEVRSCWSKGCSVNMQATYIVRGSDQTFPGMTPLMVAAFHDRPKICNFLIHYNAKLNLRNKFGDTALIIAARLGCVAIVKKLIDIGADVRIRNNNGRTALEEANNSLLRRYSTSFEIKWTFDEIVFLLFPGRHNQS